MRDIQLITKLYQLIELVGKEEVDALLTRALSKFQAELDEAYAEKALEDDRRIDVDDERRKDWEDIHGTDDEAI